MCAEKHLKAGDTFSGLALDFLKVDHEEKGDLLHPFLVHV